MESPGTSRKLETLLNISKAAAFVITSVATIYGFNHPPTEHLKFAIGFAVFGAFFGFNAMVLEAIVKRQSQQRAEQEHREAELKVEQEKQNSALEAAARERRETLRELRATKEIIVAGQPLVSLQLKWAFNCPPAELLEHIEQNDIESANENSRNALDRLIDQYEPSPESITYAVAHEIRYRVVYPFLNTLATGQWSGLSPVLAIIYLNASRISVLPLGCLNYNADLANAPVGVEFVQNVDNLKRYDQQERKRNAGFIAEHQRQADNLILEWQFRPGECDQAIDHSVADFRLFAGLSDTITIAILSSIEALPVMSDNFAEREEDLPDSGTIDPDSPVFLRDSVLQLRPNDLPNFEVRYRMKYMGRKHLSGERIQLIEGAYAPITKDFCDVSIWSGAKIPTEEGGPALPDREPLGQRLKNIDWDTPADVLKDMADDAMREG